MARRTGFYLDKRNGKLMGVCSGIADYTGFEALWIRLAFVLGTIFGGGFLAVIYLALGFIADSKPKDFYLAEEANPEDRNFWQKTRARPERSIREVRSQFRDIDRRLRDIESAYTSRTSRLAREIDNLR